MEEYVIGEMEYINLAQSGQISVKISQLWKHTVSLLPEHLKNEANSKKFTLKYHPDFNDNNPSFSYNLTFEVVNGSEHINKELRKLDYLLICMKPL
jgi:hypothetical protein